MVENIGGRPTMKKRITAENLRSRTGKTIKELAALLGTTRQSIYTAILSQSNRNKTWRKIKRYLTELEG